MKKIIALLLVISTLMSTASLQTSSATVNGFTDMISTDWYYLNVMELVNRGIISGFPDGKFKPQDQMTADQFIKTMMVALGYKLENGKGYWAQPFIDKAIELGMVKTGEFATYKEPITRAQMSVIVVRVVEKLEGAKTYKYDVMENIELLASIEDVYNIEEAFKLPITHAYELGILGGYPDGSFLPKKALPRSEACTVIRRVIDEKERLVLKLDFIQNWKTTTINGITLPEKNNEIIGYYFGDKEIPTQAIISLDINMARPETSLFGQFYAMEVALRCRFTDEVVNEIMDYVKLKTCWYYSLPLKIIKIEGFKIYIEGRVNTNTSVQLFRDGVGN